MKLLEAKFFSPQKETAVGTNEKYAAKKKFWSFPLHPLPLLSHPQPPSLVASSPSTPYPPPTFPVSSSPSLLPSPAASSSSNSTSQSPRIHSLPSLLYTPGLDQILVLCFPSAKRTIEAILNIGLVSPQTTKSCNRRTHRMIHQDFQQHSRLDSI